MRFTSRVVNPPASGVPAVRNQFLHTIIVLRSLLAGAMPGSDTKRSVYALTGWQGALTYDIYIKAKT